MKYAPTNTPTKISTAAGARHDRRRRLRRFGATGVAARATGGVVEEIVRLIGVDATETSSNSTSTAVMLSRPPASLAASTNCTTASSSVKGALDSRASVSLSSSLESPSLQSSSRSPAIACTDITSTAIVSSTPMPRVSWWRRGCTAASSGVSRPIRTHSSATLWSSVSRRSAPSRSW